MSMFSIQQLMKALRKLQNNGELAKSFQHMSAAAVTTATTTTTTTALAEEAQSPAVCNKALVTSLLTTHDVTPSSETTSNNSSPQQQQTISATTATTTTLRETNSSQLNGTTAIQQTNFDTNQQEGTATSSTPSPLSASLSSDTNEYSTAAATATKTIRKSARIPCATKNATTTTINASTTSTIPTKQSSSSSRASIVNCTQDIYLRRSQQIQKFYQQQLHHFHTQHNRSLHAKQQQTTFAMSSLAAEPLALKQQQQQQPILQQQQQQDEVVATNGNGNGNGDEHNKNTAKENQCNTSAASSSALSSASSSAASGLPCFSTGFAEIIQFMELIGNLKHTKRTGWVLRDVNDCESISGHMYRMSMMTFLLDGSEGLNQIRCMELALVHDLAESLVGDITPFCGVSKRDKRAMEFKAMEDICKLIEPRGKRIMELFEEYETGESAESKFVKDLDRLDMVMQAFEYEKRDNCLLKHQEFFDSTEGKFKHPFVQKLVDEIYEQRKVLAKAKGATPPPHVDVPNMEDLPSTNGHHCASIEDKTTKSS